MPDLISTEVIAAKILIIRGKRVMLDSDLAILYGVRTGRLNEQVTRNIKRFPEDFMFQLTKDEVLNLKSHFATSSWGAANQRLYSCHILSRASAAPRLTLISTICDISVWAGFISMVGRLA